MRLPNSSIMESNAQPFLGGKLKFQTFAQNGTFTYRKQWRWCAQWKTKLCQNHFLETKLWFQCIAFVFEKKNGMHHLRVTLYFHFSKSSRLTIKYRQKKTNELPPSEHIHIELIHSTQGKRLQNPYDIQIYSIQRMF